jgi:hypothetical protein
LLALLGAHPKVHISRIKVKPNCMKSKQHVQGNEKYIQGFGAVHEERDTLKDQRVNGRAWTLSGSGERHVTSCSEHGNEPSGSIKCGELIN